MTKKVLVTPDMFHPDAVNQLKEAGFEVVFTEPTRRVTEEQVRSMIVDVDAYVVGSNRLNAETISKGKRLKLIARFGVGYDSIDWKYALQKGIPVTITSGTNEQSVADMAVALMLSLSRRIPFFDRSVREGLWTPQILGNEIWSKTVGIIGTGRIGKAVAKRLRGFDMTMLAYDLYPDPTWAENANVAYVPLEKLIAESDYITLHTPLTGETNRMVNAAFLRQMKPTAFLVNTARGQLVDEDALYEALVNRSIAGAALDVHVNEPLPKDYRFFQLDNCILTCHISSHTQEAMRRMSLLCAEEILRMDQGLPPKHPIPEKLK